MAVGAARDMDWTELALTHARPSSHAHGGSRLGYRVVKRAFDIVFSGTVIVVGFVPSTILSIAVAKDTGGTPIYSQRRVGKGGRLFDIYKFRTMVSDADNVEKYLDEEQLAQWHNERKVDDDPRITRLGHFLRKSSIDEFPQFINVFLGQMSVVGPRAVTVEETAWYGDDLAEILSVPVGITGMWQTGPRNDCTFESGKRQQLELEYVRNASLSLDIRLFFRTFATVFRGTGM